MKNENNLSYRIVLIFYCREGHNNNHHLYVTVHYIDSDWMLKRKL